MVDIIKDIIDRLPVGFVFTSSDLPIELNKLKAANKAINKLVAQSKIRRLSKGRFYKPQISKFGELQPDTYQIVKDLIEKNGMPIGYLTGYSVFNDWGLTTQIPASLRIATKREKKAITRGIYRISFVKQENTITKENIQLFQLLDCLRFFKEIPDTMPDNACKRLLILFKNLTPAQTTTIKKLALKYNPATIALLGAILETINPDEDTTALYNALNPMTTYKMGISSEILPTQRKWYIR
jgi:predicted transcriptional regulator of viral defense system